MTITARALALMTVAVVLSANGAAAQTITQQQADEILKELKAIRQAIESLGQRQAAAAPAPARAADSRVTLLNVGGTYMLGKPDAPLTVVEFTDLQCPFCSRFATETFDEKLQEALHRHRPGTVHHAGSAAAQLAPARPACRNRRALCRRAEQVLGNALDAGAQRQHPLA